MLTQINHLNHLTSIDQKLKPQYFTKEVLITIFSDFLQKHIQTKLYMLKMKEVEDEIVFIK